MPDPSAAITYGALGAAGSAILFGLGIAKKLWPVAQHFMEFLADWRGEPDRPGFPGRPGVPARLAAVEQFVGDARASADEARSAADAARLAVHDNTLATAAIAGQLEETRSSAGDARDQSVENGLKVDHLAQQLAVVVDAVSQLQRNGGSTLRDAITRIEGDTAAAAGRPIPPQAARPDDIDTHGSTP